MRRKMVRLIACPRGTLVRRWVVMAGMALLLGGPARAADDPSVVAVDDPKSGQIEIRQGDQPVLRYNYRAVEPPEGYLDKVRANNRKYARPRSNYIHPLYGPGGEELTKDWSVDHPHHRGIYWAWPEVMYQGELADLHALQKVFARPTGKIELRQGDGFAEIAAESEWRWDDKTPIVRETATIRAHETGKHGRCVDLRFEFIALTEGVTIARRGTKAYGGLNIRLAPIAGLALSGHADPAETSPRPAWQSATGTWQGAASPSSLIVFEHAANPDYPGEFVKFEYLPWFQPTFPRSGTRYALEKGKPLVLQYRLWICDGQPASEAECRAEWQAFQATRSTDR